MIIFTFGRTKSSFMKNYRPAKVFAAACLGMFLFGIAFMSLGTVSTFIQTKFGFNATQAASLATSLPFGMLAGTLLFGPVADRFGYKYLLTISALLIVISLELMANALNIHILQLAFFLIGTGGGALNGATNALAADITDDNKSSRLSLLGVFFGIGALGLPLLMGVLTRYFNYGTIISATGWFIILPVVCFMLIRFPDPKQRKGFPVKQGVSMLRESLLILIGCVLFFESGMEGMVSNWTTTFLKSGNIEPAKALFALSTQVAAMIVARFLLAAALKKYPPLRLFAFSLLLVATGSVLLYLVPHYFVVLLVMVMFGFGFAAGFPVMLGITGERYPTLLGTAFSIVIIMALIGNTLLNYLTGILAGTWGIRFFPVILTICSLVMLILLRVVKSRIH
jgi:fucose permease